MAEWKPKRFWKTAEAVEVECGWTVQLDTRPVRTPAKAPLTVPTRALAEAIAAEWDAQEKEVDPTTMPCTRSANAAIDKVAVQHAEVASLIAAYGETDLCCYRAEGPSPLVLQQAAAWDALLDWGREALGAPLTPTAGIVPVPQPAESLDRLQARVAALDPFTLTALHDLVALSGSLLIGLAALEEWLPAEELWRRSRIDESFQESQWGVDEEAAATSSVKRGQFLHAARFLTLLRDS